MNVQGGNACSKYGGIQTGRANRISSSCDGSISTGDDSNFTLSSDRDCGGRVSKGDANRGGESIHVSANGSQAALKVASGGIEIGEVGVDESDIIAHVFEVSGKSVNSGGIGGKVGGQSDDVGLGGSNIIIQCVVASEEGGDVVRVGCNRVLKACNASLEVIDAGGGGGD